MNNAIAKAGGVYDVEAHLNQLDALRRIATQSTPADEIRVRKGRGGMTYKYVDGPYVIRTLNGAFGEHHARIWFIIFSGVLNRF